MIKSEKPSSRPFRLGDWLVLPEINRIIHPNGKHNIGSRTMQVLVSLAESQGQVVTKETLMETVWKDVVVTEDSLMKSISVLRKVFEGPEENAPKIDTIRAVGYVLLSPVEYAEAHRLVQAISKRKSKPIIYVLLLISVLVSLAAYFWSQNQNADGIVPITDDWRQERVPRLSPDGKKVLFAGATSGNNNIDIYIKDLKTNSINHLENPHNLETDPIWSPTGDEIAFFRNDATGVRIIVKNVESDAERKIVDVRAIVNLSAMIWAADGQSIIFSDRLENARAFALHRVNLETKKVTQLTHPDGYMIGDSSPRISPDGTQLAYIRSHRHSALYYHLIPGYGQLMIMDLVNGKETVISEKAEQITGVSWATNHQLMYSLVHKNYKFRIVKIKLFDSTRYTLFETPHIIRNLDFHAASHQLVFETWNESYNIWKFSNHTQKANFSSKYLKDGNTSWHPAYHEKTNQLAYISKQTGFAEIWVQDLESRKHTCMTEFEGPMVRYPRWSPDGKQLLFEVSRDRNDDIFVLDLASRNTRRIMTDLGEEKFPNWSEDGTAMYYGSNQTGMFQIYKRNLLDSTDIQITTKGGIRAVPYGNTIYYSKPNRRGLWKIVSGTEQQIVENFIPNDNANWEILDEKMYYISRSRYAKPELYYLDLQDEVQHHYQSFSYPMSYTFSGFAYDTKSKSWLITLNDVVRSDIKMIRVGKKVFSNLSNSAPFGYAFPQ